MPSLNASLSPPLQGSNATGSDAAAAAATTVFVVNAGKVCFFLCLLPAALTFLHLRHALTSDNNGVRRDWVRVEGNHAPGIYGRSKNTNDDTGNYYQLFYSPSSLLAGRVYDVVDVAAALVADPSLIGSRTSGQPSSKTAAATKLVTHPRQAYLVPATANQNVTCLHKPDGSMVCHNDLIAYYSYNATRSTQYKNNNDNRQGRLASFVTNHPATSLLIALNVGLALLYWNRHVPVQAVAKIYSSMVAAPHYEIWRSLSGTTAHFEVWHLGINMMSLLALGQELEGGYSRQGPVLFSSISFLFYNLALIPIVTVLWWALHYSISKYYHTRSSSSSSNGGSIIIPLSLVDPQRPTVGYSGVLFAWMVVASLGQSSTCPIVFLSDLCFSTYQWYAFKFNLAPIVQLIFMQILLPRVSFTGHLAGIIAGFLLHWGLLPMQICNPAVLIPGLYCMYLKTIRKVIPSTIFSIGSSLERPANSGRVAEQQRALTLFRWQIVPLILSLSTFGLFSSLTLSFAGSVLFWYCMCHTLGQSNNDVNSVAPLAKAYIVSAVLVLITDAMTCASWIAVYIEAPFPTFVIVLRAMMLFVCMVSVQEYVQQEESGIFERSLGFTTLQPCRALVGHAWLPPFTSGVGTSESGGATEPDLELGTKWKPFAGGGHRLGGGT